MLQLIKKKVDLEIRDKDGNTALQVAVNEENADAVTLLVTSQVSNPLKKLFILKVLLGTLCTFRQLII